MGTGEWELGNEEMGNSSTTKNNQQKTNSLAIPYSLFPIPYSQTIN